MNFKNLLLLTYIATISSIFPGPLLDNFKKGQMQTLVEFGNNNLTNVGSQVFYPFGGPDVTYPLLLFPNLKVLTLMGLESAKPVETYPVALDDASLSNLSSLYKRSFFITDQMARGLRNVTLVILKQIENLGGSDVSVQTIEGRTDAIKIDFTYNGKSRTILYYKCGLDNKHIDINFLENLKPFDVVLFKAASYLPHQRNFSIFRNFVLENAATFVQDSTGIPYDYLKDNFELDLHGRYLKPYKFPGGFEQLNFRKYSEQLNKPILNLKFGYGGGFVPTNILIATRKQINHL